MTKGTSDKILFICSNYPAPGGVETVTGLLADFFIARGYQQYILVLEGHNKALFENHRHALLMTEMPGPLNAPRNIDYINDFIGNNEITCVFNQGVFTQIHLSATQHPKTVFINTLHSRPFWEIHQFVNSKWSDLLAAQPDYLLKAKTLFRCLMGLIHPDLTHPNIRRFYRQQIEKADWYVVLDDAFKKELEFKLYKGCPQTNIRVIPNPLIHNNPSIPIKQKQVLYIGRLTAEPKRVDRLLRIWSMVEEKAPGWSLQIVGDGEQRLHLENTATQLGLKNVAFKGYQDPTPFYQRASILCLTSTYEGSPMVIPEAQSFGVVPLVFGSVESMYSLIDDDMNGIILSPFDENAFAEELLKLIQDPRRLAYMSENAISKVKDLTVERIGQEWLDLLEKPFKH